MSIPIRSVRIVILTALAAALAAFMQGCAGYNEPRQSEPIGRLVERFIASVNSADTDAFVAFFADDATAFFPTNAERKSGAQQIRAAVAPVFAQGPRATPARANDLQITLNGDLAVASFDAGSGSQHARRTLVLKRIDRQWKIVHLHASNVAESR